MQPLRLFTLALLLILFSINSHAGNNLNVVSSIKPIHSLVRGVMEGVGEPQLIVTAAQTPHDYSLKPSQMRHLQQADLVFWVDPNLETFLTKALQNLKSDTKTVTLSKAEGLTLLNFRENDEEETEAEHGHHDEEEHDDDDHDHDHQGLDLHLWLDPLNAKALVQEIQRSLIQVDPDHADLYRKNAQNMQNRLDSLNIEITTLLKSVQDKPYFVFHDAYQYFEKRYSLSPAGFVTPSPEISPGAKHLSKLKSHASKMKTACIFSEPQFKTNTFSKIAGADTFKTSMLDPIGALLDEGSALYFDLIRNMAHTIKNCLQP